MRLFSLVIVVLLLASCSAFGPPAGLHTFEFDLINDSPDIELLDHRYGDSANPVVRNTEWKRSGDYPDQQFGIARNLRRADDLYVKWRSKKTGQIYEETVDLRNRLPADITACRVHFLIRDEQLYIYLITPNRLDSGEAPNGPLKHHDRKVVTIYPDLQKQ